jgi:large subunit ribosomal protein L29
MKTNLKEIRDRNTEELRKEIDDKRRHLFDLRSQAVTEKLEDPSQLKKTRKDIARILTILRERHGAEGQQPEQPARPARKTRTLRGAAAPGPGKRATATAANAAKTARKITRTKKAARERRGAGSER